MDRQTNRQTDRQTTKENRKNDSRKKRKFILLEQEEDNL